jgi:hypothetical protein
VGMRQGQGQGQKEGECSEGTEAERVIEQGR